MNAKLFKSFVYGFATGVSVLSVVILLANYLTGSM